MAATALVTRDRGDGESGTWRHSSALLPRDGGDGEWLPRRRRVSGLHGDLGTWHTWRGYDGSAAKALPPCEGGHGAVQREDVFAI
jgi:hypothetical protein